MTVTKATTRVLPDTDVPRLLAAILCTYIFFKVGKYKIGVFYCPKRVGLKFPRWSQARDVGNSSGVLPILVADTCTSKAHKHILQVNTAR